VTTHDKIEQHRRFWRGEGPCLILIPTANMAQYDTAGYRSRFDDPQLMWEAEMRRAEAVLDWPTDGVPTVRPNLGVVFIPGIAGQEYTIQEGQMPWPGKPMTREAIRTARAMEVQDAKPARLAERFYAIHRKRGGQEIAAYHPDTQGVFDIAHMLYGTEIFLAFADDPAWAEELMGISLGLYRRVSRQVKEWLGEPPAEMVHGHGTSQGVYFPHAGVRVSEDTATLLSPAMIRKWLMPAIEQAVEPFGGGFVHFCGRHPALYEEFCRSEKLRAVDLGNSEMYNCRWLMERCAATGTVLYSRIAALDGEDWRTYLRRLAGLARSTGARLILRPVVFPESREECAAMYDMWHEWTA
jgi:hypothetical protein